MVNLFPVLHRTWRLLPAATRRRIYERATTAVAPRAVWTDATPRQPAGPFVVAGALTAPTGLGEAARQILHGLMAGGHQVSSLDLSENLAQKSLIPLPDLPPAQEGPGTLLLVVQPPNAGHALHLIGRSMLAHKLRIGCWVWDLEVMPETWNEQLSLIHALAPPSQWVADTFARNFNLPVRLLRYPIGLMNPPRKVHHLTAAGIRFGAAMDLGSTSARKNPLAVLRAFRDAFGPGDAVSLSIKLRDAEADPAMLAELQDLAAAEGPPVDILSGDFSPGRMEDWWQSIDVLVSLHRSEGFGLLPAEAMLRGIPVISTDWSATSEFITPETGWPVPAKLIPAVDPTKRYELPGARWADPDLAAAISALREAAQYPEEIARRGSAAFTEVRRIFSLTQFETALGIERSEC